MNKDNQQKKEQYEKLIMKFFIQNKSLSVKEIQEKLPITERECKKCKDVLSPGCKDCKDGLSYIYYFIIWRVVVQNLVKSENYLEQVEETTQQGKSEIKYDITTKGAKWIIDNDPTLDVQKFGNMLLSRASQDNSYKDEFKKEKKKERVFLGKSKRDVGFSLTDAVKYYESKILDISREFVFPQNIQKMINKLQYFTEEDYDLFRKSLPILDNLCKNKIMEFNTIRESVKLDFTTSQFNKIILKLTKMDLFITFSKNGNDFYSLSFSGLIIFHHIVSDSMTNATLKHIQEYGSKLLPRLFSNKFFSKLSKKIDKNELLTNFLDSYNYDKSFVLHTLDENQRECLRLVNGQESLMTAYRAEFTALYIQMLFILSIRIKEEFPNFKLLKLDTPHPRIHRVFQDVHYVIYRQIRNNDKELNDHKLLQLFNKIILESKIDKGDVVDIWTKYSSYIDELVKLDELIYGDDVVHDPNYLQSLIDVYTKIEKVKTVFEFRSWVFLKSSYPEICDSIINENKELKSWWDEWTNTLDKSTIDEKNSKLRVEGLQ